MKKTILLLFCLNTCFLIAQDWAPFKTTDTLRHFSSIELFPFNDDQVQSISVDSIYTVTNSSVRILKRGFSLYAFPSAVGGQRLKGQILGDTLRIYTDSSTIKSIDQFGYSLSFPHQYSIGQTFTLGKSFQARLRVQVDSFYTDTVNSTIDSLVLMQIQAFDLLQNIDTNNQFHGSRIILSKNNGIIVCPDFTNLLRTIETSQYFFNKNYFTKAENFTLTVGDEWHFTVDSGFLPSNQFNYIVRVISDTIIGNTRTVQMEERSALAFGFSNNSSLSIDTIINTFNNNDIAFNVNSLLVEDTFMVWQTNYLRVPYFSICKFCGFTPLVRTRLRVSVTSQNFGQKQDTIYDQSVGLVEDHSHNIIGVDSNYHRYHNAKYQTKSIVYVSKGTRTWGTPLSVSVGIEDLNRAEDNVNVYPNPVRTTLYFNDNNLRGEVYNTEGKLVLNFKNQSSIEVDNLLSGLYFLKIQTRRGFVWNKFIKE